MDILIGEATPDDAPAIYRVQQAAFMGQVKIYGTTDLPPLKQTLKELTADFQKYTFLRAVSGGRLIGSVKADEENGTCRIGRVIVDPEFQNHGIGAQLMAAIEERFGHCRRYELFTGHLSERNLYLYGKLGYREFGRSPGGYGGVELVHLEKLTHTCKGESNGIPQPGPFRPESK